MRLPETYKVFSPYLSEGLAKLFAGLLLFFMTFILAISLQAESRSTVIYMGGIDRSPVHTASGEPLANGYTVSIGSFEDDFDPAAHTADVAALLEHWHAYDQTEIQRIDDVAGSFTKQGFSEDPFFTGKPIFLMVSRTSDGQAPFLDGSNVLDYGLFTSSVSSWTFPTPGAMPPLESTLIHTDQIDTALWGNVSGEAHMLALKSGVETPAITWQDWLDRVFPDDADSAERSREADPAGTGMVNLLNYALNRDPYDTDAPYSLGVELAQPLAQIAGLGKVDGSAAVLTLTYTRMKENISGVRTIAQYTSDLSEEASWHTATETIISSDHETETVKAIASLAEGAAFFRIHASE